MRPWAMLILLVVAVWQIEMAVHCAFATCRTCRRPAAVQRVAAPPPARVAPPVIQPQCENGRCQLPQPRK